MADKNMTQVQALEIAVAEMENAEAREILVGMIEKRKAPRKPRVNKEAEEFRAGLMTFLAEAEGPLTNAEIAAAFEVKPQKIANNIRVLEKNGLVIRHRGEKASDKDTFTLAQLKADGWCGSGVGRSSAQGALKVNPREERFIMKHTFITAEGREKTINIPDEVLMQGRKEHLTVKETIDRYLSDEGYVVDETVAELTAKAKTNGVNTAGRATGEKKARKAPQRKPDYTKRAIVELLAEVVKDMTVDNATPRDVEVTNIERMIAFSLGDDKYEITLSKKRKPKN